MACLDPIKIKTNSTVIGSHFFQKLYNYVACGKCAECQKSKSREWLFRAHWQFEEIKHYNGYALFDTLTYAPEHLPHLSDFLGASAVDFPCFSLPDIQTFLNRLRIKIRRFYCLGDDEKLPIKYFLTSEYGTSEKGTHRPHYHLIIYVFDRTLKPLDLSYMISSCWQNGRTDGAKYNGKHYVMSQRVINAHTKDGDSAHLHQYVAKYVEKDTSFSKTVKDRLYAYMYSVYSESVQQHYVGKDYSNWLVDDDGMLVKPSPKYENDADFIEWLAIPQNHSLYLKTKHLVEQFHKQSQGFGEYLLENLDVAYLWRTGCQKFRLANKNATFVNVPLPMYYYRKLFQEQVYLGEKLVWQYTSLGKRFSDIRKFRQVEHLAKDIQNTFRQYEYQCCVDYKRLAEYMIFEENSIGTIRQTSSVDDKLQNEHWFLLKRRGKTYINECYVPDSIEYVDFSVTFEKFVRDNMIHNDFLQQIIDKYRYYKHLATKGKQESYEAKQRRSKILKAAQPTLF